MHDYLLFVIAGIVLCLAPGPDMIFLLSRTLAQGRKAGMLAAIGINLGAYVHLLAAVLGLSAILTTSAFAFTIVKWVGAAYLIFIGIQVLMDKKGAIVIDGKNVKRQTNLRIFWQGFLSDVLNPKVAIFFLAFLPQFINAESEHRTLQVLFLGCTVNIIAIIINLLLVYFCSLLTTRLRQNQKVVIWLNKTMGFIFVSLGLRLAYEKV